MNNDELTASILEDLGALCEPDARDERFRAELADLLLAAASADAGRLRQRRFLRRRERRLRPLVAPAAALALLALLMSFLVAGRGGASAEALLRRAAAVTFEPNQARHLLYDVTVTSPGHTETGTGEIWIATDAAGRPVQATETLRLAKSATAPTMVVQRVQQTPQGTYTYDATHNAIVIPSHNDDRSASRAETLPLPVYLFDGASVAQRVADLAAQGSTRVQLLSQRPVDGVTVDPVQVDGWPDAASRITLYFDDDTHLLRGVDSQSTDPSYDSPALQIRLAQQTSGPRDSAPADAFTLDAPASAQVQPPPPAMTRVAPLCGSQLKLQLAAGQSLLDICRATNPLLTKDALINALIGSTPQDLATAVAARAITRGQADAALQAQRSQIVAMLTSKNPAGTPMGSPGK
jgi:hypothetical protein